MRLGSKSKLPKTNLEGHIDDFLDTFVEGVTTEKTRKVPLLGRKCTPQLMRTFLGYELKLGKKRITCPDMTTARYLRIFAEVGCDNIEIPYDPTQTASLIPHLEKYFRNIKEEILQQDSLKSEYARRTFRMIRTRLDQVRNSEF